MFYALNSDTFFFLRLQLLFVVFCCECNQVPARANRVSISAPFIAWLLHRCVETIVSSHYSQPWNVFVTWHHNCHHYHHNHPTAWQFQCFQITGIHSIAGDFSTTARDRHKSLMISNHKVSSQHIAHSHTHISLTNVSRCNRRTLLQVLIRINNVRQLVKIISLNTQIW